MPGSLDNSARPDPHDAEHREGRREDARFLTGAARYLDDIVVAEPLHAAVVRAPHAEARIAHIDAGAARAMPGVHLVLVAADLVEAGLGRIPLDLAPPGYPAGAFAAREQPVLAAESVRHVGDPVAFVVAGTRAAALDAAEAVQVGYEPLPPRPPLGDPEAEIVFALEHGDGVACDAAFAQAAQVVRAAVPVNRVHAMPLEPRGAIGIHDAARGGFTLYVGTQRVHLIQRALADRVFRIPRARMRVIAPDTGGGFGQKNGLYPEHVLCLEAARRLGRPVKWVSSRNEAMASDCHGRANHFEMEAALDVAGELCAIRARRRVDLGGYLAPRAIVPVENGLAHLTGVYRVPAAHVTVQGIATSTAPTCPYRGAGRPENVFACERLIDITARRLGEDPVTFRRRNLVGRAGMPWNSPLGVRFAGVDLAGALDRALAGIDHAGFEARRSQAARRDLRSGIGVALFAEALHGSPEAAPAVLVLADGRMQLRVGTGSAGHGHETSLIALAAERLQLPADRIDFVQSDTGAIPDGIGTAASWSATLCGSSVMLAAEAACERACAVAARLLGVTQATVRLEDGLFRGVSINRTLDWDDVLAADADFTAEGVFTGRGDTLSVGCHACEVTVDPETGAITLDRAVVVQDCGRALQPALVAGMLQGGFAQGAAQGWMETVIYDPEDGQLLSGGLSEYAVPRAADLPAIATTAMESIETGNPLGVKGIGESAATGATAAFVNAAMDALAPLGVEDIAPPLSPARVFAAIAGARAP